MQTATTIEIPRALVLIPGCLNYFYNLCGRRVAEALGELGIAADVTTLMGLDHSHRPYDWCLLANVSEVLLSCPGAQSKLKALRRRCSAMATCALDCVHTDWYRSIRDKSLAAELDAVIDMGLCDQRTSLSTDDQRLYHFIMNGLTASEMRSLEDLESVNDEREIPWAFVGHFTTERAALVDCLIQTVDPRGFVYMPALAPYTEKGSPHLNQQQFDRVLRSTRYQIWCSHHPNFYLEPERFRASLMTGGVPLKVIPSRSAVPKSVPFRYLLIEKTELGHLKNQEIYERLRRRFREDFRRLPRLADGLAQFLVSTGVLPHIPKRAAALPASADLRLRRAA
jgi:hypothetical protein